MAIVQRLVANESPVVAEGIGKEAVYNAVRSAIYAQEMLGESHSDLLAGDKKVHVHFSRKETTIRGDASRKVTAEVATYSLGEAFGPGKLSEDDWLKSGAQTNVGKTAGAMKARLNDLGEAGISGIGSLAIGQAVRSVSIAEGYLAEDGNPAKLVVEPSFAVGAASDPDLNGKEITLVKLRVKKD